MCEQVAVAECVCVCVRAGGNPRVIMNEADRMLTHTHAAVLSTAFQRKSKTRADMTFPLSDSHGLRMFCLVPVCLDRKCRITRN